jgi:TonB family protein
MRRITQFGLCAIVFAMTAGSTAAINTQTDRPVKVIKQVAPVYPDEAQQAGVEGKVVLEVTVEKNGKLSMAKVISGPKLLQQAALDAVKQWRFSNTGNARVTLQLTMAFTLDSEPAQISRNNSSLTNTYKVNAVYPEAAKREGIQGQVTVEITVNEKGEVTEAKAVGGNEKLRQAAVDAAKQFRFSNGSGRTVMATVMFDFVLDK